LRDRNKILYYIAYYSIGRPTCICIWTLQDRPTSEKKKKCTFIRAKKKKYFDPKS